MRELILFRYFLTSRHTSAKPASRDQFERERSLPHSTSKPLHVPAIVAFIFGNLFSGDERK
jgi:hypothetical protein